MTFGKYPRGSKWLLWELKPHFAYQWNHSLLNAYCDAVVSNFTYMSAEAWNVGSARSQMAVAVQHLIKCTGNPSAIGIDQAVRIEFIKYSTNELFNTRIS